MTAEPPITLSYATSTVPRGCVSNSSMGTAHEVHVLSVKWSKVSRRGSSASPQNFTHCHFTLSPQHCHPVAVLSRQGVPAVKTFL